MCVVPTGDLCGFRETTESRLGARATAGATPCLPVIRLFSFFIGEVLGFEPGSLRILHMYCTTELHFSLTLILKVLSRVV